MGLELPSNSAGSQLDLAREDVDAVQRLKKNYPPHILASLFEKEYQTTPRLSLASTKSRGSETSVSTRASELSYSTAGSGSSRSSISVSSSLKHHRPTVSYTSSVPSISEWSESPDMYRSRGPPQRPQILSRSISDYALRDHALGVQSFPRQELFVSTPVYFCVHCGNGFEKRGDWETHEWIFHERQSYCPCPHSGCDAVFDSGKSFEAHHEAMHRCHGCKHSAECVRLLPERKVWACGFDGCKAVFLDWSKRCKHVASHYEGLSRRHGGSRETPEWRYTTTVRNLLRQSDTREPFKKFMTKCHGHSKTGWPILEWQRDNSTELKRCLEYRDFPNGVPDIIQQAYRLGHPGQKAAAQVMSRPPTPPAEESNSSLSPDYAYFGSTAPRARSQRSYLYERKLSNASSRHASSGQEFNSTTVEAKQYRMATSLPSSPPSASPPRTRNTSLDRAPSFMSETMSVSSRRTHGGKRMIAREAEVRNTSCSALASFLSEGPPGPPRGQTHRARQVPAPLAAEVKETSSSALVDFLRERPLGLVPRTAVEKDTRSSALIDFLREGPPGPPQGPQQRARQVPSPETIVSPYSDYLDDGANLPWPALQEQPEITIDKPKEDRIPEEQMYETRIQEGSIQEPRIQEAPMQGEGIREDTTQEEEIRETVLEWSQPSFMSNGTRVLPPTPGPPPIQAPPKPPGPPTLSPLSLSPLSVSAHKAFSGSPTSPVSPAVFSWPIEEPLPSPMPPGFSDMEWPLPPTPASDLSRLESTPTPTAEFFQSREQNITPTPGSYPTPELSPAYSQAEFSKSSAMDRPRTAHGLRIEVPKLMAAPPKRSKSASRGARHGKRWASISTLIEPPLPSPGIDFGFCFSQPLDMVGSPAVSSK